MFKIILVQILVLTQLILLIDYAFSQEIRTQIQDEENTYVDFNPFEWADTRLAQVNFADNPKNSRAFFLSPPKGWVRVNDITNFFKPEIVKKLKKELVLARFQSIYPYVVIAKSLDAFSWLNDPYQYKVPLEELKLYASEFLLEQYVQYKNIDSNTRNKMNNEQIYEMLVQEVQDQEFSLKIQWPYCDLKSMKRSCAAMKLRKIPFDLVETNLDFYDLPKTLNEFQQQIIPQLEQWYASNRRLHAIQNIYKAIDLINEKENKNNKFIIKKEEKPKVEVNNKQFFEYLWKNISVFTYADYCSIPTLICNVFNPELFQIEMNTQNIEILLAIKLSEQE